MNSSKKKKVRKVIAIHPRKLSSTNRSTLSSSIITPAGTKRRIINLLKNNKALAAALQDARCELSFNRKVLEESSEYLNNIKFARYKMLEMQSVLKTFVENFDEALLMLNFDDTKWLDFGASKRLCKKIQKINPIIESVEEDYGETPVSQEADIRQETIKNYGNSLNQMFPTVSDVQSENHDDIVKAVDKARCTNGTEILNHFSEENIKNIGSTLTVCVDLAPESPLHSKSKFGETTDFVKTTEEKTNASPVKYNEESGTPTLPLQTLTSVKSAAELKLGKNEQLLQTKSSPLTENHNKIHTNPSVPLTLPLQENAIKKVQTSKIPRFQDSVKAKEPVLSQKPLKNKETCKRKFEQGRNEELEYDRRKTFVLKDNEILSDFKSSATLDNNFSNIVISNENVPNGNEVTNTLCRRKTFVIKNSDILEDQLVFENDRRKTFVKKSNDQSISVQHKRNITTVTELASKVSEKSEENLENLNSNTHAPFCDKIVSDTQLKSNEIKLLSPIINKSTSADMWKENQKDFNNMEISTEVNTTSNMHSLQETNGNLISVGSNASNEAKENCATLNAKLDVVNIQNEIEDESNFFMAIMSANISSSDILKVVENDIEILGNNDKINQAKSSKLPFEFSIESSESECDLIESEDFDFFKKGSTIKTTPIRKRISDSKKKKIFVFDGKKRKSILKKEKTNEYVNSKSAKISSGKSNETRQLDTNIVPIEKEHMIKDKTVSFVFDKEMNNSNPGSNPHFSSCNSKRKFKISEKEMKSSGKSKDNYESCDGAIKDFVPSVTNALNYVDNQSLNDMPGASHMSTNPLLVTTNENLTESKQSAEKSTKSDALDINFSKFIVNMSDTESNRMEFHKVKSKKRNPPTDIVVDDIISVAKKSKKNNSRKKEETIISKNIGKDIDDLTEYKNPNVKTKKCISKSKKKDKTEPTCKKTGKNTYLVQAEIHPPPSPNRLKIENLNEENEALKFQNLQVAVVLNDVLKSKNIDMLNLSCEKDLLSQTSTKTTHNIPPILEKNNLNFKENVPCAISTSKEVSTRRRREVKSYKEPSLTVKLRR